MTLRTQRSPRHTATNGWHSIAAIADAPAIVPERRAPAPIKQTPSVGFIGQGVVGKSCADDFERRGLGVLRYSLERPFRANRNKISCCDVVFVCVPTATTPDVALDLQPLEDALALIGKGKVAVIKSTVLPGTTQRLQKKYPNITLLCSPEFLTATSAAYDAAHPFSNIIGVPSKAQRHKAASRLVAGLLPGGAATFVCSSEEAEIIKYAHNINGYMQVLTFNLLYDMARHVGAEWENIVLALRADPMVSKHYLQPLHNGGRGAGGACFIKDFSAFARLYGESGGTPQNKALLRAAEDANIALLMQTNKDLEILKSVYGSEKLEKAQRKRSPAI